MVDMNLDQADIFTILESMHEVMQDRVCIPFRRHPEWDLDLPAIKEYFDRSESLYAKFYMAAQDWQDELGEYLKVVAFDPTFWEMRNAIDQAETIEDIPIHDDSHEDCTICEFVNS